MSCQPKCCVCGEDRNGSGIRMALEGMPQDMAGWPLCGECARAMFWVVDDAVRNGRAALGYDGAQDALEGRR